MQWQGPAPNIITYSALSQGLAAAGLIEAGLALLEATCRRSMLTKPFNACALGAEAIEHALLEAREPTSHELHDRGKGGRAVTTKLLPQIAAADCGPASCQTSAMHFISK